MPDLTVSREVEKQLQKYVDFMKEHEYMPETIQHYKKVLLRFLIYQFHNTGLQSCQLIQKFLSEEKKQRPCAFRESRAAAHLYFKMFSVKSFSAESTGTDNSETEKLISEFKKYSVTIKRLNEETAVEEAGHIRRFLQFIYGNQQVSDFSTLNVADVHRYVVKGLDTVSVSSKGRIVTSIRNFFRFLQFTGKPVPDYIFKIPLSPAVWKHSSFPSTLDSSIFSRLHKIPNVGTARGKRDRAVILCFTELALRCKEVATLTLDDFDWYSGQLKICNTKTHRDRTLPISAALGNAVILYLKEARPKTGCRTLFVRFSHMRGTPMGREQIRGVVRRIYAKAGIGPHITGTHILRKTAATRIYNAGNTLKRKRQKDTP